MKKYFLILLFPLALLSCKEENKTEEAVAAVEVGEVDIKRFDKIFYESKPEDLPKIKQQFPYLFPPNNPDTVWINKINNPLLQELHNEVEEKFPDNKMLQENLQDVFRHMKYYFPDFTKPQVVTLISEMDYENKVIYTDSLVLISLDLYLGKDHRFYEFPDYVRQNFEPEQIMPDLVSSFGFNRIAPPKDRTLLSLMIYFGKEQYLKDRLLPDATDAVKMGYTPEQIEWAKVNEAEIWRYFVENKLLFDTNSKLPPRFINPAPFSKFYLELDNESPGRLGIWLGWQIVRSYMENNKDVTLQELLVKDAREIFDNSKYKPKK
jgi:gliding motility-associated lipoprotein GldB